jgi:drug/metabolite transporter (DMT)-like permease
MAHEGGHDGTGGPAAAPGGAFGLSAQGLGILLALLAPALWSTSGVFVKLMTVEALPLAGLRALIAGLVLAPFIRPRRIRWNWALLVVCSAYTLPVFCFILAAKLTTIVNAIALICTAPAWVMLMTWAAARRVIWFQAGPVAAILIGVTILLMEPGVEGSARGNWIALAGGIGFGVFTFFLPRVDGASPGLIGVANLFAGVVLLTASPSGYDWGAIPVGEWLALLYLGAIQIALATVCFGAALRRIPAVQASVLSLLEPLLSPIWTFLAVGEVPSRYGVGGGLCILGGILVDFWMRRLSVRPQAVRGA